MNTVKTLEKLLNDAKAGKLTGAVFACKYLGWHRAVYAIGDMAKSPDMALDVVSDMARALTERGDLRSDSIGMMYRLIVNPDGSMYMPFCTDASTRVVGLFPAQLLQDAKCIEGVIHPDDLAANREYTNRIAKTGGLWERRNRVILPTGISKVLGRAEMRVLPNGGRQFDGLIMNRG